MIKKILVGLFSLFVFVMTFVNFANAETKTYPHWTKSPITVYIPKDEKAQTMRHAFEKWQSMSAGKLKFQFVAKGPADIDVAFVEKVDGSDGPLGSNKITIKKGMITKAEIRMATKGNKKYSNDLVYTTMLHEIGHVLGLQESTRKGSSIMNMPVNENQDILKKDISNLYHVNGWSYMNRRFND